MRGVARNPPCSLSRDRREEGLGRDLGLALTHSM